MGLAGRFLLAFWLALVALSGPSLAADWRAQVPVLRVGFVAGESLRYDREAIEPFRRRLSLDLSLPVEIVPMRDTAMLIDAHASGRIDYAIYGATAFAAANAGCRCLEPLVVPRAADGSVGYHSVLLTRRDMGLASLADLKGHSVAFPGRRSTSGYLVPLMALGRLGLTLDDLPGHLFMEGPDAAVRTMLLGTADAAFAWSSLTGDKDNGYSRGTLARLVAEGAMRMDEVAIVWQSRLIPHGPHAVRADLPGELKALLVKSLTRMKDIDPRAYDAVEKRFSGGFVPADAAAFLPLTDAFTIEGRMAPTRTTSPSSGG